MKAKSLLAVLACILSHVVFSQPICGFDVSHQNKLKIDPEYRMAVEENEKKVQLFIQKNKKSLSARTTSLSVVHYTIPVVVHVIHTGGSIGTIYNPSDTKIQESINYLNQVFDGTYPGTGGIGDMQLRFVLATRSPNCQSTTAINRINGSVVDGYTANGISMDPGNKPGVPELSIKNLSRWSPSHYYNLWIVNKIDGNDGTSGTFTGGYAYLPGAPSAYDGTVLLATQTGSGKSTLPHEIAHAFGLYHTFQGSSNNSSCPVNSNCDTEGDRVCDTDPVSHNYDAVNNAYSFECRTGTNACTNTPFSTSTESNYMGYTTCNTLFTAGQKARVLAFAGSIYRKSLSTSLALSPTYTIDFNSPIAGSCAPTTGSVGLSGNYAGIMNIELNNRNLGSSSAAYDNGYVNGALSCLNLIQLTAGSTYTFTVSVFGANQEQLKAWIDYNNDGVFDEATELIHANSSITTGVTSGSFTIPASAKQNTMLRMRVMDDVATIYGVPAISDGCSNPTYGQAEDYPVYIMSGTLPVTLLSFEGVLKNNRAHLAWKTSSVQGLSYFVVEKSTNGSNFKKIGQVQAGSHTSTGEFNFTDDQLSEVNYYRLRLYEKNGTSKQSGIVVVRHSGLKQNVWVVNNPFQGYIELGLRKPGLQARLQLISANGVLHAEKVVSSPQGQIRWNLPVNLSRGHYVLKAIVDGEQFGHKIVKQ